MRRGTLDSRYISGDTMVSGLRLGGALELANRETITNAVNGDIKFSSVGGTSDNWLDFRLDQVWDACRIFTGGAGFDNDVLWQCRNCFGDGISLVFGDNGDVQFKWHNAAFGSLQIGTKVNGNSNATGYCSLMEFGDLDHANRDPAGNTVDPVWRVYSSDSAQADDYIEMFHDQTDANIQWGNGVLKIGSYIEIESASAVLDVDQSAAAGATPVILLDQADIDVVLMKIIGTAEAASADRTLVADSDFGTPGALTGWIQVEIQDDGNRVTDGDYYIPFYAVPT